MLSVPEPPETWHKHIVVFHELACEAATESINTRTSQVFSRPYHDLRGERDREEIFICVCLPTASIEASIVL